MRKGRPSSRSQAPRSRSLPLDVNVDQAISRYRPRSAVRRKALELIQVLLSKEGRFSAAELLWALRSELAAEGLSVAPERLRSNVYSMLRYLTSKGILRKVDKYYVLAVTRERELPDPLPPKIRTVGLKVSELRSLLIRLTRKSPHRNALRRWLEECGWERQGRTSGSSWFPRSTSSVDCLLEKLRSYFERKGVPLSAQVLEKLRSYLLSFQRRWSVYPISILPRNVALDLLRGLSQVNVDRSEAIVELSSSAASWLRRYGARVLSSRAGRSLVLLPHPYFWYRSARFTVLLKEIMSGATDTPASSCTSQQRERKVKVMGPLYDNVRTSRNEHLDKLVVAPRISITYQISLTKGGILEELRNGNKIASSEIGWLIELPKQMPSVFSNIKAIKLYFPDNSNELKVEIVMKEGKIRDRKDMEDLEALAQAVLVYLSQTLSFVPAKTVMTPKEAVKLLPYEESDTRTK